MPSVKTKNDASSPSRNSSITTFSPETENILSINERGNDFPSKIRWMVFKVKLRAVDDYAKIQAKSTFKNTTFSELIPEQMKFLTTNEICLLYTSDAADE